MQLEPIYLFYFLLVPLCLFSALFLANRLAGVVFTVWTLGQVAWLLSDRGVIDFEAYMTFITASYIGGLAVGVLVGFDKEFKDPTKTLVYYMVSVLYVPLCLTAGLTVLKELGKDESYWLIYGIALAQMSILWAGNDWKRIKILVAGAARIWRVIVTLFPNKMNRLVGVRTNG